LRRRGRKPSFHQGSTNPGRSLVARRDLPGQYAEIVDVPVADYHLDRGYQIIRISRTVSPPNHLSNRKENVMVSRAVEQIAHPTNDTEPVRRALARDANAFRAIVQTHNRCLYRIARSILRNNADAEDAVQAAYVSAFTNLASYRGEAGDDYIDKCAKKAVGPSNQTRWKSVGINHHIMQVIGEVASLGAKP
jgi:hypothetical protein